MIAVGNENPIDSRITSLTPEAAALVMVGAARAENQSPSALRIAVYPDGIPRIQGAYAWSQGDQGGVTWRDLPQVRVDAQGQELPVNALRGMQ